MQGYTVDLQKSFHRHHTLLEAQSGLGLGSLYLAARPVYQKHNAMITLIGACTTVGLLKHIYFNHGSNNIH